MKAAKLVLLLLFFPASLAAQSVALTGTVTDTPDSQTWNNGTISFTFFGPQGTSYRWTGGTLNPNTPITATLTAAGTYSVSVPDNSQITPTDSSWIVNVCPAVLPATSACFKTTKVITSPNTVLNLNPPSPRFSVPSSPQAITPISAYNDTEIVGGWVGFTYYSLSAGATRQCQSVSNGVCTWANAGGGAATVTSIASNGAVAGTAVANGTMTTTASTFTANGNSASPATPSGTTTFSNEVVLSMYSLTNTFTPPGTPTQRINSQFATGSHEGLWIGDQVVSSAGAYAANTGAVTSSTWAAAAIPLIPSAGKTISFTSSAVNTSSGSSVSVTFGATAGQVLIACIAGFGGFTSALPTGWNLIATSSNGSQNLTCMVKQAGNSEPGGYTFSTILGTAGTFIAAGIVEYANVAAIDNALTSATANWSSANVGQTICAEGLNNQSAGYLSCAPLNLVSSATTVYPLFANTQTSGVTTSAVMWGPDSTPGFTGAITALGPFGGTIFVPPGVFFLNAGQLKLPFNVTVNITGAGAQATINNGTPNAAGGSFIVGIPDTANDPIIGFVVGPGTGVQIYQTNDLIQGITIRSTRAGSGDCIQVGMEFVTIQKDDLIGCGNDGIHFLLNNSVYTGFDDVKMNLIEFCNNYGVDIMTSTLGSNYLIEQNEMDSNVGGGVNVSGQQQVTIVNNQLQFGGDAVTVTSTGGIASTAVTIGPGNWIDGQIRYTAAGGQGPTIFGNFFELTQLINLNGQVGASITGNYFTVGTPFNSASTQKNLTMDATNGNGGFTTSFTGTSGTASCVFGVTGGQTRATCFLNGYAETGAAQTWTYPLAMATTPFLTESGGSCGAQNPSTSATVLTLPANAAMTAETCQIVVEGQTN